MSQSLKVWQHFTLSETPWNCDAVERHGKEVPGTFRELLSEPQHRRTEWPNFVPMLQSILNNSLSPQGLPNDCLTTDSSGPEP